MKCKYLPITRKRLIIVAIMTLIAAATCYNIIAYNHAYAMLHFSDSGKRTAKAETLMGSSKLAVMWKGVNYPRPEINKTPDDYDFQYETCRIDVDNETELEAWYIPNSNARAIILQFHGYVSSKSILLHSANHFQQMGYATFLVDFRGSGGSNGNSTSIGYHEADDIAAAVDYVRNNISADMPIFLHGLSMGAAAILRAVAINEVKPTGIILEAVFDTMLNTVSNRFDLMGIPAFPSAHLLIFWGGQQMGFSGFKHNPIDYATEVQCPVIMLHGSNDKHATLEQARTVYANLKGQKKLGVFKNVEHGSYLVADETKWKKLISNFLKEQAENPLK